MEGGIEVFDERVENMGAHFRCLTPLFQLFHLLFSDVFAGEVLAGVEMVCGFLCLVAHWAFVCGMSVFVELMQSCVDWDPSMHRLCCSNLLTVGETVESYFMAGPVY